MKQRNTSKQITLDAVERIQTHVNLLIGQIARIIESGIQSKELKAGEPEVIARAIFLATSKFHHPAFANEWSLETVDADYEAVWNLISLGMARA